MRRLLAAGLSLSVLIGAVWAAATYVRLARHQVAVADAGFRAEAAARSRAELAGNLIHASEAFSCLSSPRLEALRTATRRAKAGTLTGDASYREFLLAQTELTRVLDETWPEVVATRESGARVVLDDLRANLLRAGEQVTARLEQLDRRVEAYRADAERFPGSIIAAVTAGDGLSMLRGRIKAAPDGRRTAASKLAG